MVAAAEESRPSIPPVLVMAQGLIVASFNPDGVPPPRPSGWSSEASSAYTQQLPVRAEVGVLAWSRDKQSVYSSTHDAH